MMMSLTILLSGLESWLAHPMIEQLGWTLVHTVWQGALLAGLLAGVLFLIRNDRARLRYTLSLTTLTASAAFPIITWMMLPAVAVDSVGAAEASWRTLSGPAVLSVEAAPSAPSAPSGADWVAVARAWLVAGRPGVAVAWMVGVSALALRLLGGWVLTARLRVARSEAVAGPWQDRVDRLAHRLGVTWTVRLRQSAAINVPIVMGWLRPVVLVPAGVLTGLPPRQIEALIAHELSHVRRHDVLVGWLQALVEMLLFYHPAVWWISKQVRVEREHCCDDVAVAVCRDRVTYAQALTTLAGRQQAMPVGSLGAAEGVLLARIRRLIGASPEPSPRSAYRPPLAVVGVVLIASLLGIAACATQRPAGDESEASPTAARATPSPGTVPAPDADTSHEAVDVYIAETETDGGRRSATRRQVVIDSGGDVTVWFDSNSVSLEGALDSLEDFRAIAPDVWGGMARPLVDVWRAFGEADTIPTPPPSVFFSERDTLDLNALRLRVDSLRTEWPLRFQLDSLEHARFDSLREQVERQLRGHREQVRRLTEQHREQIERMRREAHELQRELRNERRREQPERLREQAEALRRQAKQLEEQAREMEERRPPAPDTTGMSSRRLVPFDGAPLGTLRAGAERPTNTKPTMGRSPAPVYVLTLAARHTGRALASRASDAWLVRSVAR